MNDTLCVMQVWFIVFTLRIMEKENSLRKKEGWTQYSQRSWVLIPKVNGKTIDSLAFYGAAIAISAWMYYNGGIKSTLIILNQKYQGI